MAYSLSPITKVPEAMQKMPHKKPAPETRHRGILAITCLGRLRNDLGIRCCVVAEHATGVESVLSQTVGLLTPDFLFVLSNILFFEYMKFNKIYAQMVTICIF